MNDLKDVFVYYQTEKGGKINSLILTYSRWVPMFSEDLDRDIINALEGTPIYRAWT